MAKALRDFARANPNLIVKGGIVGDAALSASEMTRLADLPSRDTLLAQFAGALSAPMQQLAGLIQALPRNLAYGLSALLEQRQAGEPASRRPAAAAPAEPEAAAEAPRRPRPSPWPRHPPRPSEATATDEAPAAEAEAPAADAEATTDEAPAE